MYEIQSQHDYCLTWLLRINPRDNNLMMQLQKIDTKVLISMVNAFSAYYGRDYSPQELVDSKETIGLIQQELESREKKKKALWLSAPPTSNSV